MITRGNSFKLLLYYIFLEDTKYNDDINKTGKRKTCTRPLL